MFQKWCGTLLLLHSTFAVSMLDLQHGSRRLDTPYTIQVDVPKSRHLATEKVDVPLNTLPHEQTQFNETQKLNQDEKLSDIETSENGYRVLSMFSNGGWTLLKTKVIETINQFTTESEDQILPISGIKKFLEMGDKIHFIYALSNKLDPKFSKYLTDQLSPLFNKLNFFENGSYLTNTTDSAWMNMIKNLASKSVGFMVTKIQNAVKNYLSEEDLLQYKKTLDNFNPIAASGLNFLLNIEDNSENQTLRLSRMYDSYERQRSDRGDHFGGYSGSYDSGDSYGSDTYGHDTGYSSGSYHTTSYHSSSPSYGHIDPYLLLAGLGAATLLAYVAYRILVTTVAPVMGGGRRKRDILGNNELSDIPDFVYTIYDLIEKADNKYGDHEEDDFASNLNSLWQESVDGCVRCALHKQVKDRITLDRQFLEQIIT